MPLDGSGWRWPHLEKGKEPHHRFWSGHKHWLHFSGMFLYFVMLWFSGRNEYLSIHPLTKSTRKTMKKKVAKPEKLQSATRRHALELSARV